jgi:response regulator RpfG family c-di-GMP phosphodiesterase
MTASTRYSPHVALIAGPDRGRDVSNFISSYLAVGVYTPATAHQVKLADTLFVIVDIDLGAPAEFGSLRPFLERVNHHGISSLFVLDEISRQAVVQLCALGGSEYVARPLSYGKLKPIFDAHADEAIERCWRRLPAKVGAALKRSLAAFNDMMSHAAEGRPLETDAIEESCRHIVESAANDNLKALIRGLEGHHNRTFHHVLRTCGYAVGFAHDIGISGSDLQNVAIAGLMHDIGKARIPRRILESPQPLSRSELALMRKHPEMGRRIMLTGDASWDPSVIDVVVHHHEKLDGTGYPHGLSGTQISNLTLLVGVADVFAALTEHRSYKPALSCEAALAVMTRMEDKIDRGMLEAFRPIIMSRLEAA